MGLMFPTPPTPKSAVTLYHVLPSNCSQKVRLVLAEKGVPYVGRVVNIGPAMENYEPWYVRLNEKAVVPTLVDGERVVTDSARILRYVDEAFEGPALMPREPSLRAEVEAWIDRFDRLDMRVLTYGSDKAPKRLLHGAVGMRVRRLEHHLRNYPELGDAYRAKIQDVKRWQADIIDNARIAKERLRASEDLTAMETALQDGRHFLVGDQYSLADLMGTIHVARIHSSCRFLLAEHRRVVAWYERMRARPSFVEADLIDRLEPSVMARVFAQVVAPWALPRLAVVAAVLAIITAAVVQLVR